MIKGVIYAHLGPIWCLLEPSDLPYSPNQFLGLDFFYRFLQQTGSRYILGIFDEESNQKKSTDFIFYHLLCHWPFLGIFCPKMEDIISRYILGTFDEESNQKKDTDFFYYH